VQPNPDARQHAHDRWAVWLIATISAWVIVPRTLQSITAPKYRTTVGVPSTPYSTIANLSLLALTLAVIGMCVLSMVDTVKDPNVRPLGPLIVMVAPWLYLTCRDLFAGTLPTRESITYPLIVATFWVLRPSFKVLNAVGISIAAAAVISLAIALALPSKGVFQDASGALITEDKEFLPIGILVGFTTHGNTIGEYMALGLPAAFFVRPNWLRAVSVMLCASCLVWSAARTSMLAVILAGLAVGFVALVGRNLRPVLVPIGLLATFAIAAAVPFFTRDPTAFSTRGFVWIQVLDAWHASEVVGYGSRWFSEIGSSSQRLAGTVFHGHNQLVHFLATGGVLLAVIAGALVVVGSIRAGKLAGDANLFGIGYLMVFAVCSFTETPFAFVDNFSIFPIVVVPWAMLMFGIRESCSPTVPEVAEGKRDTVRIPAGDIPISLLREVKVAAHPSTGPRAGAENTSKTHGRGD
jgi:hypothetical protein